MRYFAIILFVGIFGFGAAHSEETRRTMDIQAAGYAAAFTCAAHFNAGRDLAQIKGDELHRIYPDFRAAFARLPAPEIDEKKHLVRVRFADDMPPRISAWRAQLGCTQLPVGADESGAVLLPRPNLNTPPNYKNRNWPQGDKLTTPVLANTPAGKALKDTVMTAFDRASYGKGTETTAVLVIKDGVILAELYRDGFDMHTPQRTWSVAKSIAVSIIGAAVQDNILAVNAPTHLPEWRYPGDPRGTITLQNLLHMASGLDSNRRGNRTDAIYFGGGRVVDNAGRGGLEALPGKRWKYANNDTMLAMRTLRTAINNDADFLTYPFKRLLWPLGMTHTTPETDWNGDFVMSSQVWTTARDLGRLGLLYLADGQWDGQQLLPENWAHYVANPAPSQPPLQRSNGDSLPGYGAQFWLFGARHGLPEGSYAAMGNRGQYLLIIPKRNLLIIRRGFDDNGGARFAIARFAADVLAATP